MQAQGGLTIERMCELGRVSRSGFYRHWEQEQPGEQEMQLQSRIQEIVLKHRRQYGYRRVSIDLRDEGWIVNHKRVLRLMQQDNLLAVRRRRFVLTTDAEHDWPVHPNLASRIKLTGINQLWVADITYIRLQEQFVYLAVVLDAFSRRVVGWAVDDCLHAPLAMAALRMAIETRQPAAGLIHHSDRGVQYACQDYGELLNNHGLVSSMSRPGNPYDNAVCESFIKTLKQEEIYTRQYRDLADLRAHIEQFLEHYYNCQRLHSALQYCSPEAFENRLAKLAVPAS